MADCNTANLFHGYFPVNIYSSSPQRAGHEEVTTKFLKRKNMHKNMNMYRRIKKKLFFHKMFSAADYVALKKILPAVFTPSN